MLTSIGTPVKIKVGSAVLEGDFVAPPSGRLVVFAHGSGSSRLSPRNIHVANVLKDAGFGTLLFDLLTEREDRNYATRFDVDLLAERLKATTNWAVEKIKSESLRVGYFGASTGAAAALIAAADLGKTVSAVVSRGGRPDMASPYLQRVLAPTLFIVGERDEEVLELNREALKHVASPAKQLVVIPFATHLFEEPGALDEVAKHATSWFRKYL
jgi:putative phosphoribosyl transferase